MRKKKISVAILTLNGYFNYGNRLQNYALEQVLKTYADSVVTLNIKSNPKVFSNQIPNTHGNRLKRIFNRVISGAKGKSLLLVFSTYYLWYINSRRKARFKDFSERYLHEVAVELDGSKISAEIANSYDYFVVGSDQVWNPFFPEFSEVYFLTFAPLYKRIAYAPSFGVDTIPVDFEANFAFCLKSFKNLSVREESGSNLIEKMCGIKAEVLLDPTMLLSIDDWLKFAKPVTLIPRKNYILVYFLGPIEFEVISRIRLFAKVNHMQIISLNDKRYPRYYSIDPREFVFLVHHCSIVITDSFHGVAFSIIFKKPFFIHQRNCEMDMSSRLETILNKFDLQSRKGMELSNNNMEINYKDVEISLNAERKKAKAFLHKCFL